jgi:hypothetical protein
VTAAAGDEPRTYGNWRKPTSPGLPRLGLIGTVLALGGLVVVMVVQLAAGLLVAAGVALGVAALLAPLAWRNRAGRNGWQVATANLAWAAGRRRRQHVYLAGLAGPVAFGAHRLPGLLARSELLSAQNSYGEEFGLIAVPAARHYSVVLRCDPEGSQLVDPETVDAWVASHGRWLAALAHEPGLEACTVTVETAPDPGSRLAAEVSRMLVDEAPALSRQMLTEAVATYPKGSAAVSARVTLTFTATRPGAQEREGLGLRRRTGTAGSSTGEGRVRSAEQMATLIGQRLPGLLHQLRATGAGAARALTAAEVAELVRIAYDPAAATAVEEIRAAGGDPGIRWADAGPAGQLEAWDCLRHDSAASITWQMVEPPASAVQSRVLERLLAAEEGVDRKRVTLTYRPHGPGSAGAIAHADVRTALGRAGAGRGETRAAESLAVQATRQSSTEVAGGAGLTRFSMLVTATVADPARLPAAAEVVSQLGAASQLRLRRCYFGQAASFTAALGVGVILPAHVAVPDLLRDNL